MDIIHIVLGKANPDRMNGVNKVVYQLASRQATSGRKVQVWGIANDLDHNYGDRPFDTRIFKKQKNPFSISTELKQAIAASKNTYFHLHGGWIPAFWSVAKTLKKYHKTSVLTPHGAYNTIAMQNSGWIKRVYFQLFEKRVLSIVTKIHCIGASEKQGLQAIYPNDKQHILPYGFDMPDTDDFVKKQGDAFIVGFVGRVDIHTKGLDILVEAFAKFSKQKKAELWIVGDSDEMPILKSMIGDKNIAHKVKLHGSKFGYGKDYIISQMDVFTHPSRNEGLPTAVLEAASFGVPSIVTEATNVGMYLERHNAGRCVPNESVDDLLYAFEEIYAAWQNNEMNTYIDGTQKMLNTEFSWENLVGRYDELYK